MFNTLKRLFTTMTDQQPDRNDEDQYPMLDRLAFHCSQLAADLAAAVGSGEEQNRLLAEYIERADRQYGPIDDFAEDLDWFNVLEPLSTQNQLRGKLVILDFFTYCCINCLHILPDLKRLEQLYTVADGLVVIGVHSAKFANEKDPANILAAVQRHNITHPVVNDTNCSMWKQLNVQCWPTLVVLGPRANPLFVLMGEGNYEQLEKYVGASVKYYAKQPPPAGGLSAHALPLNSSIDLIVSGALQFPGKVVCSASAPADLVDSGVETAATADEELYAIVDTGHHRILVVNRCGSVVHRIGGKTPGFVDGDFRTARFNSPQGVCFASSSARILYVADTENHSVRRVDMQSGQVLTVAGTGEQGTDHVGGRIGRAQALSSPWDVAVCRMRNMDMSFHEDERQAPEIEILLIASAGLHQIWAMFLEETIWWKFRRYAAGSVVALVGNGNEENRNNSYPANAAFAQPSGLAIRADTKELFVADSESSCVRKVQLLDGKVLAVAGGDRNPLNLFAYGNVDGKQYAAKLQHPLGVAYSPAEQAVYVADTYNHRIKRIDAATGQCSTCTFSDAAVDSDDDETAVFQEPGGLCVSPDGRLLYVADTNNHRIVRIDLESGVSDTWRLQFDAVTSGSEVTDSGVAFFAYGQRPAAAQYQSDRVLRMGLAGSMTSLRLTIECEMPSESVDDGQTASAVGVKLTPDAPQHFEARVYDRTVELQVFADDFGAANPVVLLQLRPTVGAGDEPGGVETPSVLTMRFRLNLCAGNVCYPREFEVEVPMVSDAERAYVHDQQEWRVVLRADDVELLFD